MPSYDMRVSDITIYRGVASLVLALLGLGGCENDAAKPATLQPFVEGRLPIIVDEEQLAKLPERLFSSKRVRCKRGSQMLADLWDIELRMSDPDSSPTRIDWGMQRIQLASGQGWAVAIKKIFKPGDPGVWSDATTTYLVSPKCRINVYS